MKGEKMNYRESPVYAIAKMLEDRGYHAANSIGERVYQAANSIEERVGGLRNYALGILEPREPIEKNLLGINWSKKQRALHTGTLWIDNEVRKAKHDENWVLEVYGRNNVTKLTELIRELSEPWNVKIEVRLETDIPKTEMLYLCDYDFC